VTPLSEPTEHNFGRSLGKCEQRQLVGVDLDEAIWAREKSQRQLENSWWLFLLRMKVTT